MNVVDVNVANGYKIVISRGIIGKVGEKCRPILPKTEKILIVSDSNVTPLYLAAVRESFITAGFYVRTLTFEAGEKSKTLDTFGKILNVAASLGFCRDDAFVALGGGVVGDLTGFAAACYMRGIRYVQIPTSLLAAIDSSVGGKTGADIDAGKNLVGAFHQPVGVFFDPDVLSTLPEKEWKNGLGEGVKYAVLCGGRIAEILEIGLSDDNLEEFCALCVAYKADIVARDEKESGLRQLLNLGHTVGHAEETLSGYSVPHGESVAAGIAVMSGASRKIGVLPEKDYEKINAILEKYELLREPLFSSEELAKAASHDKKNHSDGINVVTISSIGDCRITKMSLEKFGEYIK